MDAEQQTAQTTPEEAPLDLDEIIRKSRTIKKSPGPDALTENDPAEDPALVIQDDPEKTEDRRDGDDDGVPPPPDDDDPEAAPRFKSHEEAEKGYRHLQGKLTSIEQKLAKIEAGQQTRTQKEAAAAQAKAEAERESKIDQYVENRQAALLEEMDGLDPDLPDYRAKAAKAQAKAFKDIRNFERGLSAEAKADVKENLTSDAGNEPPPPPDPGEPDPAVRTLVLKKLKSANIKAEDPVFAHYAQHTPDLRKDDGAVDIEAQVAWAIEKTNNYLASRKKRYRQEIEQPLDRSSPGKKTNTAESDKRNSPDYSLSDALETAKKRRRR